MGKDFDPNDRLDRPDLNKCPDCGCFFASEACPLCGRICPEEMRAGNRKPEKKDKSKRVRANDRVMFIEWYHSWWFIIVMMFIFPIAGIILLATSPHKKSSKITFAVIAVIYLLVSTIGIGTIIHGISNIWNKPVDTSLDKEEYIAKCQTVDPKDFYRSTDDYTDEFVSLRLAVRQKVVDNNEYFSGEEYCTYYICSTDVEGMEIIVRDCLQDGTKNFLAGDIITVFGEGAGNITVYELDTYTAHTAPCVNMAYVSFEK